MKTKQRRVAVFLQGLLLAALGSALAGYFMAELYRSGRQCQAAERKFSSVWQQDPSFYTLLGYRPPFHFCPSAQMVLTGLSALLMVIVTVVFASVAMAAVYPRKSGRS